MCMHSCMYVYACMCVCVCVCVCGNNSKECVVQCVYCLSREQCCVRLEIHDTFAYVHHAAT